MSEAELRGLVRDLTTVLEKRNAEIERLREIEVAARTVLDTFKQSEAQGYRSRDRQYAIEILNSAFEQQAAAKKTGA